MKIDWFWFVLGIAWIIMGIVFFIFSKDFMDCNNNDFCRNYKLA